MTWTVYNLGPKTYLLYQSQTVTSSGTDTHNLGFETNWPGMESIYKKFRVLRVMMTQKDVSSNTTNRGSKYITIRTGNVQTIVDRRAWEDRTVMFYFENMEIVFAEFTRMDFHFDNMFATDTTVVALFLEGVND